MDAYMKLAAKKDRLSKVRRAQALVLSSDSALTRAAVAVLALPLLHKGMQDFIPPEELAKLAAKSGDKASAEALEKKNAIGGQTTFFCGIGIVFQGCSGAQALSPQTPLEL
eukprot:scaffold165588_cov18-Tisochrysis_lutea.AAC.2